MFIRSTIAVPHQHLCNSIGPRPDTLEDEPEAEDHGHSDVETEIVASPADEDDARADEEPRPMEMD